MPIELKRSVTKKDTEKKVQEKKNENALHLSDREAQNIYMKTPYKLMDFNQN